MSEQSLSYQLLDDKIQRWIWKQGWTSLKDIQEKAIPIILNKNSDVIISAETAGGKTEAVFLPILTSIIRNKRSSGYQVLYISPLKALINNQYQRLEDMTKGMHIDEVITRLKGIDCRGRGTSCPAQLAKALEELKEKLA